MIWGGELYNAFTNVVFVGKYLMTVKICGKWGLRCGAKTVLKNLKRTWNNLDNSN